MWQIMHNLKQDQLTIEVMSEMLNDKTYRLEREKYLINKFNTYYEGLNKEQERDLVILFTLCSTNKLQPVCEQFIKALDNLLYRTAMKYAKMKKLFIIFFFYYNTSTFSSPAWKGKYQVPLFQFFFLHDCWSCW